MPEKRTDDHKFSQAPPIRVALSVAYGLTQREFRDFGAAAEPVTARPPTPDAAGGRPMRWNCAARRAAVEVGSFGIGAQGRLVLGTVTIVPDAKDWTWVLRRPCPECAFDTSLFPREDVPAMIRANAAAWREPLTAPDAVRRPRSDRWSPLEYGCHVRDVLRLYDARLHMMLTEDDPLYPNWDQDATAVADRYDTQDPATVADELAAAAEAIALRFGTVSDAQWNRPGRRSDGATFTVESFARYFMHDPVHHLHDVTGSTT